MDSSKLKKVLAIILCIVIVGTVLYLLITNLISEEIAPASNAEEDKTNLDNANLASLN